MLITPGKMDIKMMNEVDNARRTPVNAHLRSPTYDMFCDVVGHSAVGVVLDFSSKLLFSDLISN